MRGRWSKKQTDQKVIYVISSIWSIIILIFVCTQILGVWKAGADVFVPLLGVAMLIQTIGYWMKNKEVDKGSLCVAIIALVFSIFKLVTR